MATSHPRDHAPRGLHAPRRFIINVTLIARSDEPEKIQRASQAMGELVDAGIVLQSGPYGGPSYAFTKLNDFKPAMVAEATASARQAADEFAKQSKSHVGGLRRASQGVFEILPRDSGPGHRRGEPDRQAAARGHDAASTRCASGRRGAARRSGVRPETTA